MPVKNSFKIFISNFSNTWKLLLYKFIIVLFGAGLVAGLVLPNVITVINSIAETGLFTNLKDIVNAIFTSFFNPGDQLVGIIEQLKISVEQTSLVLAGYADKLSLTYILLVFIWLVTNVLGGLSQLAVADIVAGDMASGAKFSFMSRYTINLYRSVKYRLVWLLTVLPINIILIFAVWFCFSLLFNIIGVVALFFAVALFVILSALKQSFFCCWLPQYAVENTPAFDSIRLGVKLSRRKFSSLFSSYILINISLIALHTILALFTCGVGLLVSIPGASLFKTIYGMVTHFELSGRKYYNDGKTIIEPSL